MASRNCWSYSRCSEGYNVRVGNLILTEFKFFLDGESQLEYIRYEVRGWRALSRTKGGNAYLGQILFQYTENNLVIKNLPRQESNHESKPREEENSSIFVERVEDRNRTSLSVNRINLWRLPKSSDFESHDWRFISVFSFV